MRPASVACVALSLSAVLSSDVAGPVTPALRVATDLAEIERFQSRVLAGKPADLARCREAERDLQLFAREAKKATKLGHYLQGRMVDLRFEGIFDACLQRNRYDAVGLTSLIIK